MYMYVYMCLHIYIRIYVYIYVYAYIDMHAYTHICKQTVKEPLRPRAQSSLGATGEAGAGVRQRVAGALGRDQPRAWSILLSSQSLEKGGQVRSSPIYIYIYIHIHIQSFTHVCRHEYVYTYIIYIYIYIHTHTCHMSIVQCA